MMAGSAGEGAIREAAASLKSATSRFLVGASGLPKGMRGDWGANCVLGDESPMFWNWQTSCLGDKHCPE